MLRVYTLSATIQVLPLAQRFREIGLNAAESRPTSARHAALRDDPSAQGLRLFRDHASLSEAELAVLFGGAKIPAGLLDGKRAAYRLDFAEDLYLFSDWQEADCNEVLPPGETCAILFRAAKPFAEHGRVLDLCCGSGTLALLLGGAVGMDLNVRAIFLANLNAQINGNCGVEFRQGSLFEPVAAENAATSWLERSSLRSRITSHRKAPQFYTATGRSQLGKHSLIASPKQACKCDSSPRCQSRLKAIASHTAKN